MLSFQSWLAVNGSWLEPLGAVIAVLTAILVIIRFFGRKILDAASWLKQRFNINQATPNTLVSFVSNPRSTLWNIARTATEPAISIMTSWYITNISEVPLRILSAGLTTPSPRGRICNDLVLIMERGNNWGHESKDIEIPPKQTEALEVTFFLYPSTQKENKPLIVRMYVTDQYGHKHKAPRIEVPYKFPSVETPLG